MSTEEKAKAFDELIKRLNKAREDVGGYTFKSVYDAVMSELAESEDEKIRKSLIDWFSDKHAADDFGGIAWERIVAWLKKQGEQKPVSEMKTPEGSLGIDSDTHNKIVDECIYGEQKSTDKVEHKFKVGDEIKTANEESLTITKIDEKGYWSEGLFICSFEDSVKWELVGKLIDKVEPKFHEGDWVVSECVEETATLQIARIVGETYVFSDDSTLGVVDEDTLRLWNIAKDAKDGDVLCCESGWTCIFKALVNDETYSSYCFMDNTKWFSETGSECHTLKDEFVKAYNGKIHPATKERRDTFFAKMKEAGYEWDAEKKELKKVEQSPIDVRTTGYWHVEDVEQKSAWSEEDERMFNSALWHVKNSCGNGGKNSGEFEVYSWLKSIKDRVGCKVNCTTTKEWSEEDTSLCARIQGILSVCKSHSLLSPDLYKEMCDWLKSLRPQNRWKPSDEMLEALYRIIPENVMNKSEDEMLLDKLYQGLKYGRVLGKN